MKFILDKVKLLKNKITSIFKIYKRYIIFILIAIGISLFGCFPYLNEIVPFGHDLGYHLNRINEIANGINIRKIPVLIHPGLIENLGYGNGFFYPQIFLYIPALLVSKFNFLVIPAYKAFLVIITFFTFISIYISTLKIFKKKHIAWVCSLLYVFSLYRLTDIYVRAALGELLAFIFMPLILYGFYNILFEDNKKWWILSIGVSGLVYSHLLSVLIVGIFFVILGLLNIDKVFKDKKVFFSFLKASIVTILITIAYFGPMFEQKTNDVFNIDGRSIYKNEEVYSFASSLGMALSSELHGGFATDSNFEEKTMPEGAGIVLILMALLFLARKDISYKNNRFEIQLFILGFAFYFATTKLFPWKYFSLLNVIQFPFRFNMIAMLCFSVVGGASFCSLINENNKKEIILLFTIFYLAYSGFQLDNCELDFTGWNGNYNVLTSTFDRQVGSAEYLPDGTYIYDLDLYNTNDKENKIKYTQVGNTIQFEYNDTKNPLSINIPLVYYKGYTAYIEDENGNKTDLEVEKNITNAHVLVKNNEILNGKITVEYKLTKIQKISYLISIISIIAFSIYIFWNFIKVFREKK